MKARYTSALFLLLCAVAPAARAQQMRLEPARYAEDMPSADPARMAKTAAERRGFFASLDWLAYNGATAVDANGGVHLSFYFSDERHDDEPRELAAYYTYCPGQLDCADPANWNTLIQFDSQVNEIQVVATQDGRPRVLVRRYGSRAYEYDYWACDVNCVDPQNWWGLRVLEAAGTELWNTDLPQHSFALDSQDRPRFIYSNGWGVGRPEAIYYAWCDAADCTEPDTWEDTNIYGPIEYVTITADYASLVFDGNDNPRVVTRMNRSGLPERVDYHQCDANCDERTSWYSVTLEHPEGKMWANWDLELDAMGRPRIALYEPAGIDIYVGGKLYYGWCDGDCREPDSFEIVQIAHGEGKNVDLEIDSRGRTYMVYDAGERGVLATMWCDGTCTDPMAWDREVLETSEQLAEEFWPANPLSCSDEHRAWLDAVPDARLDADDELVVAYDVKNVAICYYYDPTRPNDPPQTHVDRIWWTVRLGFYGRPGESSTPIEEEYEVPTTATLEPNFPNPFNPATTIPFTIEQSGNVKLTVHDMLGRTVAVLVDGMQSAGRHEIAWNASAQPSGTYLYRLEAGGKSHTRKLTLLK
ncbi:MAG TPA: T9SS type A sorting domain-containing protein [Rhodothermales bacterium]